MSYLSSRAASRHAPAGLGPDMRMTAERAATPLKG